MTSPEQERVIAYQATVARLEPDIAMIDHDAGIASIAISLKRIADALEKPPTDAYHLKCPGCGAAIDLIPETP